MMPNTRWGRRTRAETIGAEDRLIDAALVCYQRLGTTKTTVADIAAEASVTRRTVYRYFKGHREILYAVTDREMLRFWDAMLRDLAHLVDFSEFLVESFFYTQRYAADAPATHSLFAPELLAMVNEAYLSRPKLIDKIADWLEPPYRRSCEAGLSRPGIDLRMVAEWSARLLISYLASPSPIFKTESDMRTLLTALWQPILKPSQ